MISTWLYIFADVINYILGSLSNDDADAEDDA